MPLSQSIADYIPEDPKALLRIGIIGGGDFCEYILRMSLEYRTNSKPLRVQSRFVAVADDNPEAPGLILAREKGLYTTTDFHDLYRPELEINHIFLFTTKPGVLEEVLKTKPSNIRLLTYQTLMLLWDIFQVDEKKIKFQRDELITILNGIQEGIGVFDIDYNILQVNKPLLESAGMKETEVLGRKCHEIFHLSADPCQPPDHPCPLRQALEEARPVNVVHVHPTFEGEDRIIDLTLYPIMDSGGQFTRFIEISRDITEKHRAQEKMTRELEEAVAKRTRQLEESHRKLLQQDKMSSLGKLSASVVHELNNPLGGILNFTRLIRRTLSERELTAEVIQKLIGHLELMETETNRCSKIVSNLLTFARQSKLEPEAVELNQILDRIIEINAHHLELNGIQIQKDYQSNLPPLFADADQLKQVFMNLIFNAMEAIPKDKKGLITISTSYDIDENMLQVRIADSGIGIQEENLPYIFEPFFTTKYRGKGVGMGLSVVYGIVKDHHGQIEVEATGPEGTVFLTKLPPGRIDDQKTKTAASASQSWGETS